MRLSKNFTLEEVLHSDTAKRLGIDNTPDWKKNDYYNVRNLVKLVTVAQKIRDYLGKPIKISSGFRGPILNKRIGGARSSDHMFCAALDIQVRGMSNRFLFTEIVKLLDPTEYRLIIEEYRGSAKWIHISISRDSRPTGRLLKYVNGKYSVNKI